MRTFLIVVLAVAVVGVGLSMAAAAEPMLICPDRVVSDARATQTGMCPDRLVDVAAAMSESCRAYLLYTPFARYAFGAVMGQVSPDRALAERTSAGITHRAVYAEALERARYGPWCVCDQVSPDTVRAERVACGTCTY